jgi:hypothetical protein
VTPLRELEFLRCYPKTTEKDRFWLRPIYQCVARNIDKINVFIVDFGGNPAFEKTSTLKKLARSSTVDPHYSHSCNPDPNREFAERRWRLRLIGRWGGRFCWRGVCREGAFGLIGIIKLAYRAI